MPGWFLPALAVAATSQLLVHALRPLLSYLALSIGASPDELGL